MKRNHGDMPVWNFIFKEAFFMPFNRKPQKFNAAIKSVVIGSGDKTVTLGGENVLPFYAFDGEIKNGPKVLENPSDYNAMAEIMWCGSLSHNGLTECGRGKDFSVHKFGHALSAKYDVAHGASLAAVWGAWAKYQYDEETVLWRFARFAEKVWGITEGSDHKRATEGIERTVAFFHSLGMPTSLHELDIPNPSDEDLRALSMDATQQDTVKLSRIRKLGAQEVYEIYQMAR
jgi:alcohol dehydrogenase YqhD (iron-dependent ADH family)